MDGYEAAKAIRSLENRKLASVPILAMTANAFGEDKQEALRFVGARLPFHGQFQ